MIFTWQVDFMELLILIPVPQLYPLQSDTANASWYLLRMHQCETYSFSPGTINVTNLCAGDTVTFSVSQGGPQYQWEFSPGLIPIGSVTGDSVTVAVDTAAIQETVYVYSVGGCLNSTMVYATVIVNQPVIPIIVTSILGDSLLTQLPAIYYQWYLDGSVIPSANDSSYQPLAPGFYMVMTIDSNGCSAFSDSLFFIPEGVSEINGLTVSVYPKSFTNELRIVFDRNIQEGQLIITDIMGKVIHKSVLVSGSTILETISWRKKECI